MVSPQIQRVAIQQGAVAKDFLVEAGAVVWLVTIFDLVNVQGIVGDPGTPGIIDARFGRLDSHTDARELLPGG